MNSGNIRVYRSSNPKNMGVCMRKLILSALAVASLSGCYYHEYRHSDYVPGVNPVNPSAVPGMIQMGYSENDIRGLVIENGVLHKPSTDDLISLKQMGVSDALMSDLIEAPVREPRPAIEYRHTDVHDHYCEPDPVFNFGAGLLTGYLWARCIYRH